MGLRAQGARASFFIVSKNWLKEEGGKEDGRCHESGQQ